MESNQNQGHLIMFFNIPYNYNPKDFFHFALQFGEISEYLSSIDKQGICFATFFDMRCAKRAVAETNIKSNVFCVNYSYSFFPMNKVSSKIWISYKDNRLTKLCEIIDIVKQFGDIQQSILISPQKAEITFFDSRSSDKACNSEIDDLNIILILNDAQRYQSSNNYFYYSNIISNENQNSSKIKSLTKSLSLTQEENRKLKRNEKYRYKYSNLCGQMKNKKFGKNNSNRNRTKENFKNLQPNNRNIQQQPNFNNTQQQPNFNNTQQHPNFDNTQQQPNFNNTQQHPNFDNIQQQPNFNNIQQQPNFDNIQQQPNFDNTQQQPNFNNHQNIDHDLMAELIELYKYEPHARKPSEKMLEYCLASYFYSAKGYRYSLQSFPFPAVSTLYKHFGVEMKKMNEYICDIKYVTFLLESFIEIFGVEKHTPVIIAGDATAACADPMFKDIHGNCYLYLYQLQPFLSCYPVFPMNIRVNFCGNFHEQNLDDMKKILDCLDDLQLDCLAIATDDDSGNTKYHIQSFNKLYPIFDEHGNVVAKPQKGHPILDLPHVLKMQRARFFRQDMALSPESPIIKKDVIQRYLSRCCFEKHSESIRFHDDYGIDFFSPFSFLEIINYDEICFFSYYLLPFILWQTSIRYVNLSINNRIVLLSLSLMIFSYEYDNFNPKNVELGFYEENAQKCKIMNYWCKNDLIKFINTIVVDIYSIKKYSKFPIGLQRLATGVEEKTFANVRKYMNNSINKKLFIEILVHKIMTNEINEELDLHGSTNYHDEGGVNISNEMVEHFEIPENNFALRRF